MSHWLVDVTLASTITVKPKQTKEKRNGFAVVVFPSVDNKQVVYVEIMQYYKHFAKDVVFFFI